ncbi:MAG: heme o synthase [Candidatus Omnitrophota bacterium]
MSTEFLSFRAFKATSRFNAYLELSKIRILSMVLVTTAIGFFLGKKGFSDPGKLLATLLGTALVCAGASALNHYLERDSDSKMLRTRNRPIPAGIIPAQNAMLFGIVAVLLGVGFLYWQVNLLVSFLGLLTAFLYVLVYTPMKKVSWLNTTIGAIPGALPPVGGWAAAAGQIDLGAWVLFLILFIWQHPHFYAIAWMLKEDYARGGFKMLPVLEKDGHRTMFQVVAFSILLIPASVLPVVLGISGSAYFFGALILGVGFLAFGIFFAVSRSDADAHKLLRASIIYLPVILSLIIADAHF